MRLHLLEHDPLDWSNTNITSWAKKKGHTVDQTYVCNNEKLPSIQDFDWLMVMGGSPSVWEEDKLLWLRPEKEMIQNALEKKKMILGICFGAQLIAEALGGIVSKNKHREIGWYDITLTKEGRKSFLFQNIPERFTTFHWHSDHICLPPDCTRLASSEATFTQAFVKEGIPIAGVQFHPEYTREIIIRSAIEEGDKWFPGPFVKGKEAVLTQTEVLPETDWLMTALLQNMEQKFVP
jgi:GMP synthase-like glutamine amidotransferase